VVASPFFKPEYDDRLSRVRSTMATRGLDALVIADPENINWLNGNDAWSFYMPQMILIDMHDGPFWMGLEMDAGAMG
jgi:ectoine hydrolase